MLFGAALQGGQQGVQIDQQQVGRPGELDGKTGIQNVGRGHALVNEAGFRADLLGQFGQEGDDVVFDLGLDGVDAGDALRRVFFKFP